MPAGEDIANILKEIREQIPEKRTECPECSTPLIERDDGTLWCRFCGWKSR